MTGLPPRSASELNVRTAKKRGLARDLASQHACCGCACTLQMWHSCLDEIKDAIGFTEVGSSERAELIKEFNELRRQPAPVEEVVQAP
eukprot:6177632-Pleurochrysis_carterae.AAC.3